MLYQNFYCNHFSKANQNYDNICRKHSTFIHVQRRPGGRLYKCLFLCLRDDHLYISVFANGVNLKKLSATVAGRKK